MACKSEASAATANPTTSPTIPQFSSSTSDSASNGSIFPRENTTQSRPHATNHAVFLEEGIDFPEE